MWDYSLPGSDADTAVYFDPVSASNDIYRIRIYSMIDGVYKYLTAEKGYGNGDNVSWKAETGGSNQQWKFVEYVTPTGSKTLTMPKNYNQFYTDNPDDFTRDCYRCSCCNCASFYRGYPYYTLSDAISDGAYADDGFYPGEIKYAAFTKHTAATTIAARCTKMREEINDGRPVIVHFGVTAGHYVTDFKYINGGASYADFYVLDSGN